MNLIISLLVIVLLVFLPFLAELPTLNKNIPVFIAGFILLFIPIATLGIILLHRHTKTQKKQTEQHAVQIFSAAVKLLGSPDTLVRTGGICALHKIAWNNQRYGLQAAEILISHIRSKTQEPEYQSENKYKPSDEIQTAINLLFIVSQGELGVFNNGALYSRKVGFLRSLFLGTRLLPRIDLSYAYLVGADFRQAHCEAADFRWANCEGADFGRAHCEGANFSYAHCEGAEFGYCQAADFSYTHCEGANFSYAHCQGADFSYAHCEGVNFSHARCQGTNFRQAHCQGVNFGKTHCQKGEFEGADCRGAYAGVEARNELELRDRVGEVTEISDAIISGEYDTQFIKYVKKAERRVGSLSWSTGLIRNGSALAKKFEDGDKGMPIIHGKPEGIIEGVLEDSEDLQKIMEKLYEIKSRKKHL